MTSDLVEAIAREFTPFKPDDLARQVSVRLGQNVSIEDIVAVLVDDEAIAARTAAATSLRGWDAEIVEPWAENTRAGSTERRELIYSRLGIPSDGHAVLDEHFPREGVPVLIADPDVWTPWYTVERRTAHDFYWRAYKRVLAAQWNDDVAVGKLDVATTNVVSRLADPTRDEPYQSKGLVVGYVQSGKTANFSGVLAKSMDAGYRLIVVLTGTIEMLRSQTQRRLDKELIGRQNIGADSDYENDEDWIAHRFLEHEVDPNTSNSVPAIRRLTGADFDFKALGKGLGALHYEFADHSKPLNDPKNLFASNIRVAIVKKNSTVLKKLVDDLRKIPTDLAQIPTLIIDDEADQASVNTINPAKFAADKVERTAINERISELLALLKRSQYVGYTATPFANVFVDPVDSENIFPKDFILSLERPKPYMGGRDFHDFDDDLDDSSKTPANSNQKAFVRDLLADWDDEGRVAEQQQALDSFVLAGAMKLFRESRGNIKFRHHTMLVHQSVKQAEHAALADEFKRLWKSSGYSQPSARPRLEMLWNTDFEPVSAARAEGAAVPNSFDELYTFVGKAHRKISEGVSPVIIVNGAAEKDYAQDALDFQERPVWKILVGGAKLSRGFTVEGLTTTYYTRRTPQADTLMQMGRWFGFRPGYKDLVRLFIGRNVPGPAGKDFDMYKAFESIVQDEEEFRTELERFARVNTLGEPLLTPRDVPPMVFQSQPWLKPTAANKMYNAEQAYRGVGGQAFSFTMQRPRGKDGEHNRTHFDAVEPLLRSLKSEDSFYLTTSLGTDQPFSARHGVVPAQVVLEAVEKFVWDENWDFEPHLAAMRAAIENELLEDFAILLPQPKNRPALEIVGWHEKLPIVNRRRRDREYRSGFSGTAVRERQAIEHIAGSPGKNGGQAAQKLYRKTRGGLILLFANDPKNGSRQYKHAQTGPVNPVDFATLFSYALPYAAEPTPKIGFRVKKSGAGAIVDAR